MEIARVKCPHCGGMNEVEIPTDRCLPFHKCAKCGKIMHAAKDICCVICAYSGKRCPTNK